MCGRQEQRGYKGVKREEKKEGCIVIFLVEENECVFTKRKEEEE